MATPLLVRIGVNGGPWVAVLAATAVAVAVAETALPAVLGHAIDDTLADRGVGTWLEWLGLLVAILVACDALDDLAAGGAVARSTASLRRGVVRHLLALRPETVASYGAGEISGRLVGNAAHAGRVVPDAVRAGANLIPAVGGTIALGLIDPWLCVTLLAGLPIMVALLRRFVADASDQAEQYLDAQGVITARLTEAVAGARTVAAAATVEREAARVLEPLPALHRHGLAMWAAQRNLGAQEALVVPLLELAVLAVAGVEFARGVISPGQFLAAGQYAILATALTSTVGFAAALVNLRAAAGRVAELLAEHPVRYGAGALPAGGGQIEFRGVTVRRGGKPVIDQLDLVVPAGAAMAIVGRSGSGRTLLAALAGRLLDPDEGEILLDGIPLRGLARAQLRRAVTYGFERPALIGRTLADTIAFGIDSPSRPERLAASTAARADEFIRRMPRRYRTLLADAPMSGGEVQRLGLARAFAHAGRVLVFDDVAASLDTVTEHHISEALAGAFADRTRIFVAGRASTAARADIVVWLERGRIRGIARHEELWRDDEYRALFEPQEEAVAPASTDGTCR